jgi:hypothetical protein
VVAVEPRNVAGPLMSVSGYERPIKGGQSVTALPRCSDVDLLRDGERIVNLDAEVPDGALHLGVPKEKLNGRRFPVRR